MYGLGYYRTLSWIIVAVICGYGTYMAVSIAGASVHLVLRRKPEKDHGSLDGVIAFLASISAAGVTCLIGSARGAVVGLISVAVLAALFLISDAKNTREELMPTQQLVGDSAGFGLVALFAVYLTWFWR